MKIKVTSFARSVKELKETCMKEMMNEDVLMNISGSELTVMQQSIKLIDEALEIATEQASMIESMNEKLDKLLAICRKLES